MNIKIYVKNINIIKNHKKILKKLSILLLFLKKFALPSQKFFKNL